MGRQTNVAASGGVGVGGLLLVLFIGLKLTKQIDWAWKWVLAPVWVPLALVLVFVAFCLIMAVVTGQVQIGGKKNRQIRY